MTAAAAQRLLFYPRWGRFARICPFWRTLWTRRCDESIAWTYSGNVSIAMRFLNAWCVAAALREQMKQAARLGEFIWVNLEEIGYGE